MCVVVLAVTEWAPLGFFIRNGTKNQDDWKYIFSLTNVRVQSEIPRKHSPSRFLKSAAATFFKPIPIVPRPPACASIREVATGVPTLNPKSLAARSVSPWPHGWPGSNISLPGIKNDTFFFSWNKILHFLYQFNKGQLCIYGSKWWEQMRFFTFFKS